MTDDAVGGHDLLRLDAVEATRGSAFRLGPLDLSIRAGETVALLGANAAGKSTTLAVAVGEIEPAAGHAWLGGAPPRSLRQDDIARRAAHLRQQPPPLFALTVLEVVLHGRWVHLRGLRFPGAADEAAAREALARAEVEHLADRDFRALAGGERQRVLIAKALAQASPLLLLDEPTVNLDLRHRVALIETIAGLGREPGRGVLLVTHDLDAAAACDRVVILRAGRCLAAGPVSEVMVPGLLREAFGHPVLVDPHPDDGRPRVTPRRQAREAGYGTNIEHST